MQFDNWFPVEARFGQDLVGLLVQFDRTREEAQWSILPDLHGRDIDVTEGLRMGRRFLRRERRRPRERQSLQWGAPMPAPPLVIMSTRSPICINPPGPEGLVVR